MRVARSTWQVSFICGGLGHRLDQMAWLGERDLMYRTFQAWWCFCERAFGWPRHKFNSIA